MSDTINFSIRLNAELKNEAETLFSKLGMDLSTAVQIFLRQSVQNGGMPFEIKLDPSTEEMYTLVSVNHSVNHLRMTHTAYQPPETSYISSVPSSNESDSLRHLNKSLNVLI